MEPGALYPLATYLTLNLHLLDHTGHLHLFYNKPWYWSQFRTLPDHWNCQRTFFHGAILLEVAFQDASLSVQTKANLLNWAVSHSKDTGLYYDEYLKQVIDVLETDQHFREKLQKADIEEIRVSGTQLRAAENSHWEVDQTGGSGLLCVRGVEDRHVGCMKQREMTGRHPSQQRLCRS